MTGFEYLYLSLDNDVKKLTLFAFIEQGGVRVHVNKLDTTGQGIESVIVVH